MRKFVVSLLSSLVVAVPFMATSSALANNSDIDLNNLTHEEGVILSWRLYADYKADEALKVLNHLKRDPGLTSVQDEMLDLLRLMIYRQEGKHNVLIPGFTDEAIAYLTEAIVIDDTNAHARRRRGAAYCKAGNFTACQRDYAVAWELTKEKSQKNLASHLWRRGSSYQKAGRIREGNADLKEAARLYRLMGDVRTANVFESQIRPE